MLIWDDAGFNGGEASIEFSTDYTADYDYSFGDAGYVSYLYLLGVRRPRGKRQYPFPIRAEVAKLHRYQRQMKLLQTYRIDTDRQLAMLGSALQADIDALAGQRKELYHRKRAGEDVTGEIETINQELRRLRGQLRTCGQIEEDIPRIRDQVQLVRKQQAQEKAQTQEREHKFQNRKVK